MSETDGAASAAPTPDPATPPDPAPPPLPRAIRLLSPHGFIADDGAHRHWPPGPVITDPADIALLIARGAADIEIVE